MKKLYVGVNGYFPKCSYDVKLSKECYPVSVGSTSCTICEHFIKWDTEERYVKCKLNDIDNRKEKLKRILQ